MVGRLLFTANTINMKLKLATITILEAETKTFWKYFYFYEKSGEPGFILLLLLCAKYSIPIPYFRGLQVDNFKIIHIFIKCYIFTKY